MKILQQLFNAVRSTYLQDNQPNRSTFKVEKSPNLKQLLSIILCTIICSCMSTYNKKLEDKSNYYFMLGNFYGEFDSIRMESDINNEKIKDEYYYDKNNNVISLKKNGKDYLHIWYNKSNLVDSVIDVSLGAKKTTYYYDFNFHESYTKYSKINGVSLDFTNCKIDSFNNRVIYTYDNRIQRIDSFDLKKNLIKQINMDSQAFEMYEFDKYDNIKNSYMHLKNNGKDSVYCVLSCSYEYDERNNWTTQITKFNDPYGRQYIKKAKRFIDYKRN